MYVDGVWSRREKYKKVSAGIKNLGRVSHPFGIAD